MAPAPGLNLSTVKEPGRGPRPRSSHSPWLRTQQLPLSDVAAPSGAPEQLTSGAGLVGGPAGALEPPGGNAVRSHKRS